MAEGVNVPAESDRETVTLDQIANFETRDGQANEPSLRIIGFKVFRWLVVLIAFLFVLLCLYGFLTYPRLSSVEHMAGPVSGTTAISEWSTLRDDWFNNLKDIGQLFLIGPLVPLLGIVIGYLFGRSHGSDENSH